MYVAFEESWDTGQKDIAVLFLQTRGSNWEEFVKLSSAESDLSILRRPAAAAYGRANYSRFWCPTLGSALSASFVLT